MDILRDKISIAEKLASESLSKSRFDADAFLVLGMIELLQNPTADRIKDSNVDENAEDMLECFERYFSTGNINDLQECAERIYLIVSEMAHLCRQEPDKEIMRSCLNKISAIVI